MQLRFGAARSGWLPVLFIHEGVEYPFFASAVPSDFVTDLASALDAFLGTGSGTAVLHEEPRALRWSFVRRGDEGELSIDRHPSPSVASRSDAPGRELVRVVMPSGDLALLVWRGLRALEAAKEGYLDPKDWPHPFPSALLAQAAERMGRRS